MTVPLFPKLANSSFVTLHVSDMAGLISCKIVGLFMTLETFFCRVNSLIEKKNHSKIRIRTWDRFSACIFIIILIHQTRPKNIAETAVCTR
jgi:hypothetical protein